MATNLKTPCHPLHSFVVPNLAIPNFALSKVPPSSRTLGSLSSQSTLRMHC